jgi:hypothetical protein
MPDVTQKILDLLSSSTRHELQDGTFGDVEITWTKDKIDVAWGYFGRDCAEVNIHDASGKTNPELKFKGEQARLLRDLGDEVTTERNDPSGPATFMEGIPLRGVPLAGVYDELTAPRQ